MSDPQYDKLKPQVQVNLTMEDVMAMARKIANEGGSSGKLATQALKEMETEKRKPAARRPIRWGIWPFRIAVLLSWFGFLAVTVEFSNSWLAVLAGMALASLRFSVWLLAVWAAAYYLFAWIKTARAYGLWRLFKAVAVMGGLARYRDYWQRSLGRRLLLHVVLAAVAFAVWKIFGAAWGLPAACLAGVITVFGEMEDAFLPPVIHLLARSSPESSQLQKELHQTFRPLRITSLLDVVRGSPLSDAYLLRDIFRTKSEEKWRHVAFRLTKIAPIVVIDTRSATEPVIEEFIRMSAPDHIYKVLFVVQGDAGELLRRLPPGAREGAEAVMMRVQNHLLSKMLMYMVQGEGGLPTPGHSTRGIMESALMKARLMGQI